MHSTAKSIRRSLWGYWLVAALLSSILMACASSPPQTPEVDEPRSAALSENLPTQTGSTGPGPDEPPSYGRFPGTSHPPAKP